MTNLTAHIFPQSSSWILAIFFLQILSIALISTKVYALFIKRKITQKQYANKITEYIRADDFKGALTYCQTLLEPISKVAQAGISSKQNHGNRDEIQKAMDEILLKECSPMEKGIGQIALVANLSTLIGLIGTVTSLISILSKTPSADSQQKQQILSQYISLSTNTMAYALIVAIPCLIMYAILKNRASRLTDDLNKAGLNLFIQLEFKSSPSVTSTLKRKI